MLKRLFGGGRPRDVPDGNVGNASQSPWAPMTDTPADARRTRPREWLSYLDARAASLEALRSGDVQLAARRAAETARLHASWRGYAYEPSPFTAPAKLPLSDLQLVGLSDPASVRVELRLGSIGLSIDAVDQAKRLIGITISDELKWPWFEDWRRWFTERASAPPTWGEDLLVDPPDTSDEDERLRDRLRPLSVDERIAVVYGGHAVPIDLLAEDLCLTVAGTRSLCSRLATAGLARYPAPPASRLARALTIDQLKEVATAKDIAGKGRKDAIVAALVDHIDDQELERLAPGEFVELVGLPRSQWTTYRRAFVELWAHTMSMSGFKAREIQDTTGMRDILKGYSIIGDDQCLFCRTKNGTRVRLQDVKPETFPPFHPGCRCATAPWGQWE